MVPFEGLNFIILMILAPAVSEPLVVAEQLVDAVAVVT